MGRAERGHGGPERPTWARRRAKGAGVVVARFGAHLGGRPPLKADGHGIRGAYSRWREVNELVLLEDFRILISSPADEVGGGFLAKWQCRVASGAPASASL